MYPRLLISFAVALGVSACRIQITVPENGRVTTLSGAYVCEAGDTCMVDVVDIFFDETFVAVADEGYFFAGWKRADGFFCGGSTDDCHLYTSGFEGNDSLEPFLESDDVFFLEPVFTDEAPELALTLSGNWSYTQQWGDCSASGVIEQFLVEGEGVYQTLSVESVQVNSINPCSYVAASDFSNRTVGPISTVLGEPLTEAELQAAYDEFFGGVVSVEVFSADEYRVTGSQGGVTNATTYTRVGE